MDNLFDTYPDAEPAVLTSGSLWAWTRQDITDAYPPSLYTLRYRLALQVSPYTVKTITAGKVSSAHVVEVTDPDYDAGTWRWQAVVVRDSDSAEVIVGTGMVEVIAKVSGAVLDTSSWVYKVLTAIRATIQGSASKAMAVTTINGRTLQSRTLAELLELEREFASRWDAEQRRAGVKRPSRRALVSMSA